MASFNKICLIGYLGRDPEIRYTTTGQAVANFSMATTESWTDKATGEKKENTTWFRINAWGRLGEICGQYLTKGKQIYVEGRISLNEWQDKDGNNRANLEVNANQMIMLSSKNGQGQGQNQNQNQYRPAPSQQQPGYGQSDMPPVTDGDDTIPF